MKNIFLLLCIIGAFRTLAQQIELVKDVCAPVAFQRFNNNLYFNSTNGACNEGDGIYRSNGSTEGTVKITNRKFDGNSRRRGVSAGHLYFGTFNGELRRINGNTEVDELIKNDFNSIPTGLVDLSGILIFTDNGNELWRSDGTEGGTYVIREDLTGIVEIVSNGSTAFLRTDQGLFKTDGTSVNTVQIPGINESSGIGLTIWQGDLYFKGISAPYTSSDYYIAKYSNDTISYLASGISFGNTKLFYKTNFCLFFIGRTIYTSPGGTVTKENQLWKTDGTVAGTILVKTIDAEVPYFFRNMELSPEGYQATFLFPAMGDTTGTELWKSDGTANGTTLVKDINYGIASSTPVEFSCINGLCYFMADDGIHGVEVWKSDGTNNGTQLVQNLNVGAENINDQIGNAINALNIGRNYLSIAYKGRYFFQAKTPASTSTSFLYATVNACPESLIFVHPNDNISTGTITKQAAASNGNITASNHITGSANVTYQAKSIELTTGFKADSGSVFKVETGGCSN